MTDLNDLVAGITIESNYGPTVQLNDPFAPGTTPGAGHYLLELMKPKVIITLRDKNISPIEAAPWGQPGYHWPAVRAGLAITGLVVGGILLRRVLRR